MTAVDLRFGLRKLVGFPTLAALIAWTGSTAGPSLAAPARIDRVIVNAMEYPWSSVGRVNSGGRGYCTGVLVSERHVLTKARCLYYGVEGRWWSPSEVHFIAGYQRDDTTINSKVASYRTAPGFTGGAGQTLANFVNDWAILTLREPIGRQAGWVGLQWLDQYALGRLARGDAYAIEAGYRPGQEHVVTVALDCGIDSLARRHLAKRGGCREILPDTGLSTLVFIDGEFRALGTRIMRRDRTLRSISAKSSAGNRPPSLRSPADSRPQQTISRLLVRLGYLDEGKQTISDGRLRTAIMAFQMDRQLRVTGEPSVNLLGHLMSTTVN